METATQFWNLDQCLTDLFPSGWFVAKLNKNKLKPHLPSCISERSHFPEYTLAAACPSAHRAERSRGPCRQSTYPWPHNVCAENLIWAYPRIHQRNQSFVRLCRCFAVTAVYFL